MSSIAFTGPVRDVAAARAFAGEVNGARRVDFVESRKRLAITKERIFLVEGTPMGAAVMVYAEGLNAGLQMARLRVSSNAFDKFYLASVAKMSAVDVANMPPGPPPHLVFEWAAGRTAKACTMIAAPVPDPAKFWALCRDMTARYVEHGESRSRVGATLERAFYLHDARMAVVYLEGDDPMAAMEKSMHSDAGYDRWFTEQISAVHGIDFRAQKPPRPELLISYDA